MTLKRPLTSLCTIHAFSHCMRKNPSLSVVYLSVHHEDSFFTLVPEDSIPIPDFEKAGIEEDLFVNLSLNKYPDQDTLKKKGKADILRFINEELPNEMYFFCVS